MNYIERAISEIKEQYRGIDYSKGQDMTVICIRGNYQGFRERSA